MTPADQALIAEIKERLKKATPGPWYLRDYLSGTVYVGMREGDAPKGKYDRGFLGAHVNLFNVADFSQSEAELQRERTSNGDLIAHAPTDLKALIELVERQEREIGDLEEIRDTIARDRDAHFKTAMQHLSELQKRGWKQVGAQVDPTCEQYEAVEQERDALKAEVERLSNPEKTSDAVSILHKRYIKDEPERKASLELERIVADRDALAAEVERLNETRELSAAVSIQHSLKAERDRLAGANKILRDQMDDLLMKLGDSSLEIDFTNWGMNKDAAFEYDVQVLPCFKKKEQANAPK